MLLLLTGMIIFFGVHLVPSLPLKQQFIDRYSKKIYRQLFIIIAFIGLSLMIYGKIQMAFITVWEPPYWTRHLVMAVMPLALFFLALPDIPNNFRRHIRHPMMIGITIWSGAHLAANGDLSSILLFGGFFIYAIFSIIAVSHREEFRPADPVPKYRDAIAIIFIAISYAVIFKFHHLVSGVQLV